MHDEERDLLMQAAVLQEQLVSLTTDRDRLRRELAELEAELAQRRTTIRRFRLVGLLTATAVWEWTKPLIPFLPWAMEF